MVVIFLNSSASLSSMFFSTMIVFKVFSYSKIITLIQSPNLVLRIFKFDLYSFVISLPIDVNRAVQLVITIPMLRFINGIVEEPLVDPDPMKVSVIINNTFFLFND